MKIKKVEKGKDPCEECRKANHGRACVMKWEEWTASKCKSQLRDNEIPIFNV